MGMMSETSIKLREEDAKREEEEMEELGKVVYVKNLNFTTE